MIEKLRSKITVLKVKTPTTHLTGAGTMMMTNSC